MSEGVETSGCINISNAIVSDDSMRGMIRFSILSQGKYLMRSITGVKVNVNIEILWQRRRKLTVSMFLYQEEQGWASRILPILFFR